MAGPVTTIDFALDQFDSELTMAIKALLPVGQEPTTFDVSATAIYQVSVESMKNAFYFESDSRDLNNLDAEDLKYYVVWNPAYKLNPSHALVITEGSSEPIALTDAEGAIPDNRQLVKHDFIRHIAKDLFNTHLAVDLFSNETEIVEDLASKGNDAWTAIETSIANVSAGGSLTINGAAYMTNAEDSSANLCRVLFRQAIQVRPERFDDLSLLYKVEADNTFFIPFKDGDSISFKVVYKPEPTQHTILESRATSDIAVPDRVYRIKIEIKDTPDPNTVVDDSVGFANSRVIIA